MRLLISFLCGTIFAIGLGISGMTNPEKVIGFLTLSSSWDPSLAFVMIGAIAVHFVSYRLVSRRKQPWLSEKFDIPINRKLETRLFVGAVLFGLGWGLSGFCPGPAVVSSVTLVPKVLIFCAAMLSGFALYNIGSFTLSLRNKA
ncbi:MAG: DUF6691 family protein [Myxococcota bacterium]|nr:DUF6691 family protein [Myxococcota bacterium]